MFGFFRSSKILVILLLLVLVAVFLSLQGKDTDSVNHEDVAEIIELVAPDIEEESIDEEELKEDIGGVQAGILYADLFCSVADPAFWDDFFEGDSQTEAELLTEEQRTELFYAEHGYPTEFAGNTDISIHWGEEIFKETVRKTIENSEGCITNITNNGMIVDDVLNEPSPEM